MTDRYNVIVIGAGSGGLTVAAGASALGAKAMFLRGRLRPGMRTLFQRVYAWLRR